jgi:hypothetical protein
MPVNWQPRRAIWLLLAAALVACEAPAGSFQASPTAATPTPATSASPAAAAATAAPTADRVAGWRSDLERIVPGMDRIHPNLTHGTSLEELNGAVAALSAEVETASDDELMVGVLKVAAMVSADGCDGHTGAFIWGTGSYPVDSLPLRLWLFEDEVVIVDAMAPYEDLIGSRIDGVDNTPIADVLAALDPLIPRDNDQTVRLLTPRYLLIPQVLRGLGLAGDDPITLGLTSPDGATTRREIQPAGMAVYNEWAGSYGLHLPADPDVLSLSNIDDDLWWELLPDTRTLYVQYNRVEHQLPGVLAELGTALRDPDVSRVVLDIRHNFGGEVPALDPMFQLFDDPAVDVPGELFVITGRNTLSAGSMLLARMEAGTEAVIVGEPMAGCPTFYGDTTEVPLPYSGLSITVTGMLEVGVDPEDPRSNIELDLVAPLTFDDWVNGRDPALELIVLDVN